MNPLILSLGSIAIAASVSSCERKPSTGTNTSEYREGKSGATSSTIIDGKTDNPTSYPAAKEDGVKKAE
ncbi:MAG: hypothetical protein EOP87_15895 [Verrucomicrobiaceae bacterium]|nr:MAG: hypothetical protein EOP87_15895 [Verrucomicrobiaceae bacterium]